MRQSYSVIVRVADDHDFCWAEGCNFLKQVDDSGAAVDRVELLRDVSRPAGDPGAQAASAYHDTDGIGPAHAVGRCGEMREETGLEVEPGRLLYVCDHLPGNGIHVVHLTFEARRTGGSAGQVTAGVDTRPIRGVEFVKLADLPSLGFSERFGELAMAGFPGAGSYMGPKAAIGVTA